jgi:Ser/Thr protein kinase RdoA (MazF antagonist)
LLKLKYLFNNKDLAQMILDNWEYDSEDPNLFEYYRISTNAIYWCKNKGSVFFLRFTPAEEKSKETILAELEYLSYLKANNYPAVESILSKRGNELEEVATPWGVYYACAFKKAPGVQISRNPFNDEIIFNWGKALGKLHSLSSNYQPQNFKRSDWLSTLDWTSNILSKHKNDLTHINNKFSNVTPSTATASASANIINVTNAANDISPTSPATTIAAAEGELNLLKDFFTKLPITKENYGLVHFDFESDNLFFNESTHEITPIDFDDATYHWFAMDICQALESIKDDLSEEEFEAATSTFIDGYRTEFSLSDDTTKLLPIFNRFAKLYGYARILHSIDEKWNNEPDWMLDLRKKLNNILMKRSASFGLPLFD